jgi:biotin operon repressor
MAKAKKKSKKRAKKKSLTAKAKRIAKTKSGRTGIGAGAGAILLGPIGAVGGALYGASTAKKNPENRLSRERVIDAVERGISTWPDEELETQESRWRDFESLSLLLKETGVSPTRSSADRKLNELLKKEVRRRARGGALQNPTLKPHQYYAFYDDSGTAVAMTIYGGRALRKTGSDIEEAKSKLESSLERAMARQRNPKKRAKKKSAAKKARGKIRWKKDYTDYVSQVFPLPRGRDFQIVAQKVGRGRYMLWATSGKGEKYSDPQYAYSEGHPLKKVKADAQRMLGAGLYSKGKTPIPEDFFDPKDKFLAPNVSAFEPGPGVPVEIEREEEESGRMRRPPSPGQRLARVKLRPREMALAETKPVDNPTVGQRGRIIARALKGRKRPMSTNKIGHETGLSDVEVTSGLNWLRHHGWVQKSGEGYKLMRNPSIERDIGTLRRRKVRSSAVAGAKHERSAGRIRSAKVRKILASNPLAPGPESSTISGNIKELIHAGVPQRQAVAASYEHARATSPAGMVPPAPNPLELPTLRRLKTFPLKRLGQYTVVDLGKRPNWRSPSIFIDDRQTIYVMLDADPDDAAWVHPSLGLVDLVAIGGTGEIRWTVTVDNDFGKGLNAAEHFKLVPTGVKATKEIPRLSDWQRLLERRRAQHEKLMERERKKRGKRISESSRKRGKNPGSSGPTTDIGWLLAEASRKEGFGDTVPSLYPDEIGALHRGRLIKKGDAYTTEQGEKIQVYHATAKGKRTLTDQYPEAVGNPISLSEAYEVQIDRIDDYDTLRDKRNEWAMWIGDSADAVKEFGSEGLKALKRAITLADRKLDKLSSKVTRPRNPKETVSKAELTEALERAKEEYGGTEGVTKEWRRRIKAEKRRKVTPEWRRLINRCQKLWESYCERPGKKRLRLVLAHLEKMKASTSAKVKAERRRCLRAAKAEAKKLKMKL